MSAIKSGRGRVAALTRSRKPNDPELIDARRKLAADKLAAYISRVVDAAPPLTDEQRSQLTELLRPARAQAAVAHGGGAA